MSNEKTKAQTSSEGNAARDGQSQQSTGQEEARGGAEKNVEGEPGAAGYMFEQFRVPRGCLGYAVADPETKLAALIDPELEMIVPMLDYLFEHGLRPRYIIDTHTHADHVSGAKELKEKTTAKLVMHEKAPASGVDLRVRDGERIHLGELAIKFLYTPGHAKDLVSVLVPGRLLTADAMLIGSCGRTDLLNGDATQQCPEKISYDLLHLCPPQSAPDFIKHSPLANEAGYVEVDKHTLQHTRYPNVFSLGDASSLPTSKTGAAIRKQAPTLVHNLLRLMSGADLSIDSEEYHGYSSCPLVTDYGKMMLAEFDYSLKPTPSFPPWDHDSRKETYTNWLLKTRGLPNMYWHGMLRGLA